VVFDRGGEFDLSITRHNSPSSLFLWRAAFFIVRSTQGSFFLRRSSCVSGLFCICIKYRWCHMKYTMKHDDIAKCMIHNALIVCVVMLFLFCTCPVQCMVMILTMVMIRMHACAGEIEMETRSRKRLKITHAKADGGGKEKTGNEMAAAAKANSGVEGDEEADQQNELVQYEELVKTRLSEHFGGPKPGATFQRFLSESPELLLLPKDGECLFYVFCTIRWRLCDISWLDAICV
jgi:hypothetical protein